MYTVDNKEISSLDEVMEQIKIKEYNSVTLITVLGTTIQMSNLSQREVKSTIGRMSHGDLMIIQGSEIRA